MVGNRPGSTTQRFPEESNERLVGPESVVAVVPEPPDTRSVCPSTTVADSPVVKPAPLGYIKTRLLLKSATQRFPEESNESSYGNFSVVAVVPGVPDVKFVCPSTTVAALPLVPRFACGYIKIRLLTLSATQRFREGSNERLIGPESVVAVISEPPDVKIVWPSTTVTALPLVPRLACGYLRIRLLPPSATQRFPEESNESAIGMVSVVAVVPEPFDVKIVCPSTTVADSPFVKPAPLGYINTRLLAPSTTQRFPEESNESAIGMVSVVAVVPEPFDVKIVCPSTTVADSPFVKPAPLGYINTRLLAPSTTQRFPEES